MTPPSRFDPRGFAPRMVQEAIKYICREDGSSEFIRRGTTVKQLKSGINRNRIEGYADPCHLRIRRPRAVPKMRGKQKQLRRLRHMGPEHATSRFGRRAQLAELKRTRGRIFRNGIRMRSRRFWNLHIVNSAEPPLRMNMPFLIPCSI